MGEVILSAKQIKAEALRLGFSACGVAPAEAVNKTVSNAFCHWHSHGMQAGMNYKSVVYPRVYNILSKYSDYRTTCDFIILFQTIPIEEIIQWKNKRKQNTICNLALYLYNCNINTEDDLAEWILDDGNAESLLEINGVGRKTIDYMKLLSGQQAIPIDRHMFQFLEIAGVLTADYKEASRILRKTASVLEVGESVLDKTIWNYMSQKKSDGQMSIFDIFGDIMV